MIPSVKTYLVTYYDEKGKLAQFEVETISKFLAKLIVREHNGWFKAWSQATRVTVGVKRK